MSIILNCHSYWRSFLTDTLNDPFATMFTWAIQQGGTYRQGPFIGLDGSITFEKDSDAIMFVLKWSSK